MKMNVSTGAAGAALCVMMIAGCYSGPVNIPATAAAADLVQLAQEASDKNRYSWSQQYYEAVLERFPEDTEASCGAEYEIAFIHYKQKRYDEAERGLMELLSHYEQVDGELLPEKYEILANIVLEKITKNKITKRE
jgi:outer membrane protein assembly factor BamD (BamD/ComL family)